MISFAASASNMENVTVEQARASNMEEDTASSPNKGNFIDVGSASDIEMATPVLDKNGSESRRSECCIYRVPNPLRNVNWKAYAPLLISIGPLHRANERLEAMEKEKWKYFKKLTKQMDKKKDDIEIIIKNQEEPLRRCYSKNSISMETKNFIKMVLLDAVFIIQFFLESNDDKGDITEDLMLFENQLPLFIIQEIYDYVNNPRSQDAQVIPFLDLATTHFRKYSFSQVVKTSPRVKGSKHFTDLLRNLMLSTAIQRSYSLDPVKLKYSAVMLRKAGVRFQVARDSCLVNITFDNDKGVLTIPHLKVDRNFELLVRNIMAMEQCMYEREAYICSYIKFMDQLIDTAGDVGLLVEKGIILHWLRDDAAVSNMINIFCENIDDKYTCFGDISKALNEHYDYRWNHSKATLKLVYFPNIWRGTATVAATILLILTFIQTISSVNRFIDFILPSFITPV